MNNVEEKSTNSLTAKKIHSLNVRSLRIKKRIS